MEVQVAFGAGRIALMENLLHPELLQAVEVILYQARENGN